MGSGSRITSEVEGNTPARYKRVASSAVAILLRRALEVKEFSPPEIEDLIQSTRAIQELLDARLLDVNAVCELLDCSRATVLRQVRKGNLPKPIEIDHRLKRWRFSDLKNCLDAL